MKDGDRVLMIDSRSGFLKGDHGIAVRVDNTDGTVKFRGGGNNREDWVYRFDVRLESDRIEELTKKESLSQQEIQEIKKYYPELSEELRKQYIRWEQE